MIDTAPSLNLAPGSARIRRVPPLGRSLRTVAAAAGAVAVVFAAWWYLAPPALGGATSVTIVDGTSMLPGLQRDDLVLIRPAATYGRGDVVAYRSHLIHRVVLHRIVAIENGRYTFKGDNNTYLDPEQPTRGQLIGKRWHTVPRAGRVATIVRRPLVAASIAVLLVLVWGLGGGGSPRPRGEE